MLAEQRLEAVDWEQRMSNFYMPRLSDIISKKEEMLNECKYSIDRVFVSEMFDQIQVFLMMLTEQEIISIAKSTFPSYPFAYSKIMLFAFKGIIENNLDEKYVEHLLRGNYDEPYRMYSSDNERLTKF